MNYLSKCKTLCSTIIYRKSSISINKYRYDYNSYIKRCNFSLLRKFAEGIPHSNYSDLHKWSINNIPEFWNRVWDFGEVIGNKGKILMQDNSKIQKCTFFPDAELNFAQNLLKEKSDNIAITSITENHAVRHLTYNELHQEVAKFAKLLNKWGVKKGDRVVGYLPNIPETIIAMLATSSLGAIWSSCSTDFGIQGVIDRFSQIEPKVLIATDGYHYKGKAYSCLERLPNILNKLPTIEKVVVVSNLGMSHSYQPWGEEDDDEGITITIDEKVHISNEIIFTQLNFNDPLYILYSSGTTGVPKCIVHGVGGSLLKHLVEHQLHFDIKPGTKVFYYTTCGWMMWNWLAGALASRAHIFLYDGCPTYPSPNTLWDFVEQYDINIMGVSSKYLSNIHKQQVDVTNTHKLTHLTTVAATGSPLVAETYDYIHNSIKKDVHINNFSGGTDLIGSLVIGHIPFSSTSNPVVRGEIQGPCLGYAVDVYDQQGQGLPPGQFGELVCTRPFPSRPLGFWNDLEGKKYHEAYYARYPNTWHQGDYCQWTSRGGMIIIGRSDATLNPGGIRIGTAEIYRQLENIPEIIDCLAIGQKCGAADQDERIILFVVVRRGLQLSEELKNHIKKNIRINTTTRHVPAMIIAVPDLPKTKSNKLAEIAVREIVHGRTVKNQEALINPETLLYFKDIPELKLE